jgi:hypothetical protein
VSAVAGAATRTGAHEAKRDQPQPIEILDSRSEKQERTERGNAIAAIGTGKPRMTAALAKTLYMRSLYVLVKPAVPIEEQATGHVPHLPFGDCAFPARQRGPRHSSAADPIGRLVKQRALRGASKSHPRLYPDRLVISAQTLLVAIQQTRFHERCNILVDAPIIAAERNGKRTDASSPVPMHMAQKLKPLGRHDSRERFESPEADVPFGVLHSQIATLCAMPSIHETTTHAV